VPVFHASGQVPVPGLPGGLAGTRRLPRRTKHGKADIRRGLPPALLTGFKSCRSVVTVRLRDGLMKPEAEARTGTEL
jgi:hypothetical protein